MAVEVREMAFEGGRLDFCFFGLLRLLVLSQELLGWPDTPGS